MNGYKFLLRLCVVLGIVSFFLIPMMVGAADIHNTTVIVLDGSGSMDESMRDQATGQSVKKMDAAKKALKDVIAKVPSDTHVGILVFTSGRMGWLTDPPLGQVQENIFSALDQVSPGGGTPLGLGIKNGTDMLLHDRQTQNNVGRYQLIVVTDGENTQGPGVDEYAPLVAPRGIRMDVIGVAMPGGATHQLAQWADSYQPADDAVSLQTALKKAIVVEAGGKDAPADFSATAGLPMEVAKVWLAALSQTPPNYPLGEQPPVETKPNPASAAVPVAEAPPAPPELVQSSCSTAGTGTIGSGLTTLMLVIIILTSLVSRRRLIPVRIRR
ncbi:VWA domain-containing protein [Candidatus Uhrbacteria bacterium]|nr:VWA domain-containing protein [Candidatus Uhrbacteria bacterium]